MQRARFASTDGKLPVKDPTCGQFWASISVIIGSFFHDSHSGLVEVFACFFSLILWRAVGGLLVELISFSLFLISFCSFF